MFGDTLVAAARHLLAIAPYAILFSWAMTFFGAYLAYVAQTERAERSFRGYMRFCFPARILKHPSLRLDIFFNISFRLLHPFILAPLLVSSAALAAGSYALLTMLFGEVTAVSPPSFLTWALILVALMIAQDFATFYAHYIEHKFVLLWQFHKTHHSAEILVPLTNRRFHPVQTIIDNGFNAIAVGGVIGTSAYFLAMPILDFSLRGLEAYWLINALSFHHLRHSHIRLSYGWLERYLLSPAQHQLHHSSEVHHWDKNFGLLLSCWDRWFKTIVYTNPTEQYRLGLPPGSGDFSTVTGLYISPIRGFVKILGERMRRHAGRSEPAPGPAVPEA
ncbi:MAG: sterol desaturase family protein [Paracraurococcus sp.]